VSRYNRARHARRQVGSAFKPFVFAAALQEGIPTSQLVMDVPLRMQLSRNDVWEPSNYDGRFEGQVSLRTPWSGPGTSPPSSWRPRWGSTTWPGRPARRA
jgi:membrane carboxypeptidase/penicillin-binding protein